MADDLATEIANIEYIVNRELARSRDSHEARQYCKVAPIAARLHKALSRQPGADHIDWQIAVPATFLAPFDEFDLTELLGNLLDNALKWAKGRIVLRAGTDGNEADIIIADDGTGIPEWAEATALEQGGRLDAGKPGSGLGLSIAKEMAEAHGCQLALGPAALGPAALGGLEVRLFWATVDD